MNASTQRAGDWMQTYSGVAFWPIDPRPEEIDIEDIAHALSHLCRFGGHCLRFYSVAEHCVLLARAAPPQHALWALLHDAAEAYLVDLPRPIKASLPGYKEAESRIEAAVITRFGLSAPMPVAVKSLDTRILTDEATQNMSAPPMPWSTLAAPIGVKLQFWAPEQAKAEFLSEFERLSRP